MNTISRRHLLAVGLPITLATAGIMFWVTSVALSSHPAQPPSKAADPTTCALRPSALMPHQSLDGLTQIVDEHLTRAPIKGDAGSSTPRAAVSDFSAGHLVGYLSTQAIDGPDRPQEDAYARSLGYAVGHIPLVPLSGPVVRDTPGLLEAYELIAVYHSDRGAQDFARFLTQARVSAGGTVTPMADVAGASAYFQPAQSSGPNPPYEQQYEYIAQFGRVVVRLDFSGGAQLDPSKLSPLALSAEKALSATCSR